MYCTELNDVRNEMWDGMLNVLGVELFVDLWSKPDLDILDILLGGHWPPLRNRTTRTDLQNVLNEYAYCYFKAAQANFKWLH